jgi:hypothetical protein
VRPQNAGSSPSAERRWQCYDPVNEETTMKMTKNWGMILLAVWLILTGLIPLLSIHIENSGTIMSLLAVAAGVLVLTGR